MPIISCPSCYARLRVGEATLSKSSINCPKCKELIRLPEANTAIDIAQHVQPRDSGPEARPSGNAVVWIAALAGSIVTLCIVVTAGAVWWAMTNSQAPASRQATNGDTGNSSAASPNEPVRAQEAFRTNPAMKPSVNADESLMADATPTEGETPSSDSSNDEIAVKASDHVKASERVKAPERVKGSEPDQAVAAVPEKAANVSEPANAMTPPASPIESAEVTDKSDEEIEPLRYSWTVGKSFIYDFVMTSTFGETRKSFDGSVSLNISAGPEEPETEVRTGTGTGFVVTSNGHLLTCAHVVDNATKIEVQLAGKTYAGFVVDTDTQNDVAIVKIDGRDLACLPLADSSEVELAQQVFTFGYPMASILGEDLKVTHGAVSGISMHSGRRIFQLDATVNPGNSGGPVTDSGGKVIGVTTAKLYGVGVAQVGFAVPIRAAEALLRKSQIHLPPSAERKEVSSSQLAAAVRPTVAYIKVTSGPSDRKLFTLKYEGQFKSSASSGKVVSRYIPRTRSRGRFGYGGYVSTSDPWTRSKGTVVVDNIGHVVSFTDTDQLPFLMGSMGALMVHQLDEDGNKSWSDERRMSVHRSGGSSSSQVAPFGINRFSGPFRSSGSSDGDQLLPAVERFAFLVTSSDADSVTVQQHYEMQTLDDAVKPYMKISGSGHYVFDRKYGVNREMKYKHVVQQNTTNISVTVPVSVEYTLRDPEEILRQKKIELAAQEKAKAKKEAQEAKEAAMPPGERALYLLGRVGGEYLQQVDALSKLERMSPVSDVRSQVAAGLMELASENSLVFAALGTWATAAEVPKIVEMLRSGKLGVRDKQALVPALGSFSDRIAIEFLAESLSDAFLLVRD